MKKNIILLLCLIGIFGCSCTLSISIGGGDSEEEVEVIEELNQSKELTTDTQDGSLQKTVEED